MIKFAAAAGALDEGNIVRETLGAIKRAGADAFDESLENSVWPPRHGRHAAFVLEEKRHRRAGRRPQTEAYAARLQGRAEMPRRGRFDEHSPI